MSFEQPLIAQPEQLARPLAPASLEEIRLWGGRFGLDQADIKAKFEAEVEARVKDLAAAAGKVVLSVSNGEVPSESVDDFVAAFDSLGLRETLGRLLADPDNSDKVQEKLRLEVLIRLAGTDMSQKMLAERIGKTESYVSRLLSGKRKGLSSLRHMSRVIDNEYPQSSIE